MTPKPPDTLTPDEIRAIRTAKDLTLQAAADAIGASRRAWIKWESGESTAPPWAIKLIWLLKHNQI